MAEHDQLRDLDELARIGEEYASPMPAERVRQLGQRRRTRRRVALVSAVAIAMVVAGGAVVTTTGLWTHRAPNPVGTPSSAVPAPTPSTPPSEDPVDPPAARGLTLANLPTESDLEWHKPGDWKMTDTYSGVGGSTVSRCFAPGPPDLPAFRSDFRLADSAGDRAGAVVMEFADAEAAETAYAIIVSAGSDCRTPLAKQGHQRISVGDWLPVELPSGKAQFIEASTEVLDDPTSDETHFGAYGVVWSGDRLAVVAMDTVGLDSNWSYVEDDPTGLAMHPMFRTLPKVAERLRG